MIQDDQKGLFGGAAERRRKSLPPKQADESEAKRRGRERQNIRHADFGNASRKSLMYTLDDRILNLPGYNLTIAAVAKNANVGLKTTYRLLKELAARSLISYGKVDGSSSLYWFRIHHCNVPDFIGRPWGEVEEESEDDEGADDEAEGPLAEEDSEAVCAANLSPTEKSFSLTEKPFLPQRKFFSHRETSPLIGAHLSTPPPPTPSQQPEADWVAVVEVLIRLGVGQVRRAVDAAKRGGYSPEQVLAVAAVFESKPGAWTPGAIFFRLEEGSPMQPPDAGWPPVSKAFARREQAAQYALSREADRKPVPRPPDSEAARLAALAERYGGDLEAMSDGEREALAADLKPFERTLFHRSGWRFVRMRLLEVMHARDGPGETAGG